MHLLFLTVALFVASTATTIAAQSSNGSSLLSDTQIEIIYAEVRAKLRDPDSAKFGNMGAAATDTTLIWACGWVNARNGYGGYTGFQPFQAAFIPGKGAIVVGVGGSESAQLATIDVCRMNGVEF